MIQAAFDINNVSNSSSHRDGTGDVERASSLHISIDLNFNAALLINMSCQSKRRIEKVNQDGRKERERDVAGGVKWETCVCAMSGRASERERAQVCERMRRIDGPSDCHLAFDRQRERVRETQLGLCQDLSTELYQSANSHGRRQRWRCKEREKFNNLTFPPKAERDRASELCSGEENSCMG